MYFAWVKNIIWLVKVDTLGGETGTALLAPVFSFPKVYPGSAFVVCAEVMSV